MLNPKRGFSEPSSVAVFAPARLVESKRGWVIPYRAIEPLALAIDAAIIFATAFLSDIAYSLQFTTSHGNIQQFAGFAAVVTALFILLARNRDLYTLPELLNLKSQIRQVTVNWWLIFLFLTAVAFAMKMGGDVSRGSTLGFAISGFAGLLIARVGWRLYLRDGAAFHKFSTRKVALIAEEALSHDPGVLETLTRHGLHPSKQFMLPVGRNDGQRRKDVITDAIKAIRGSDIEEIVLSLHPDNWAKFRTLLSELRALPLPVNLVPAGPLSELFQLSSHKIGETITIELQRGPRTVSQRIVKRFTDIVIAVFSLIAFLPLFLIVAIAIKLDSPGPVVFRQRRRGFNGRTFQILKFRTMSVQEDGDTVVAAQRHDRRVTRIGNWLRRTSIDELPQLLNVLQGTMSIVGPRPHALAHDNEFEKLLDKYAYRHHVKPGLTGWAQVHGYRGEMSTIADIRKRIEYDLWYIDNGSLATDLRIMLMTATELVSGRNAF
jgi:putative colanic acid biosynthesis UDP-glucose lipid carrier transferase